MKFSVVTVCYNAVDCIEQTMLSVLNQTYSDIEYIIIDGGSTDGTVDIIKKYADRLAYWISEPDKGIYDAMNKGIAVATGDYINFMNAGDRFYSKHTINEVVVQYNGCAQSVIYGSCYVHDGNKAYLCRPKPISNLKNYGVICHQSAFIYNARDSIQYDTTYRLAADYDLFCRLFAAQWNFFYIDIPVCFYNQGGVSDGNQQVIQETYLIASKYGTPSFTNYVYRLITNKIKYYIKLSLGQRITRCFRTTLKGRSENVSV